MKEGILMYNIYLKDLLNLCNAKLIKGNLDTVLDNFSKDTRTINENDIYVGIKGENFDGSIFYQEAFNKGAKGCILNNSTEIDEAYIDALDNKFVVLVDDTVFCLQQLAKYKRSLCHIPVIGVTGSVGKTSTKDIIASVLSKKYKVLKTIGNYNNHIGLPLTILSLKDEEAMVLEMGMNNLGEISTLSKIAKPTLGVITNVGTSHIGNLGSRENILKAKLEILDGMDKKMLVINNDNDLLHQYYLKNINNTELNFITFGINNDSLYQAKNIIQNHTESTYNCLINDFNYQIDVLVPGEHFVLNSLCALAVGKVFDVAITDILSGIKDFELTKKRMEIIKNDQYVIINDCYNANYDSMKAALDYLGTLKNRKVAVLGDMLELGEYSKFLHESLADVIINNHIDLVICVGKEMQYLKNKLSEKVLVKHYDNNIEAIKYLKNNLLKDDNILIKASNGMHFTEILEAINES